MYDMTSPRAADVEQQPLLATGAEYSGEAANRAFRRVGWIILPWIFLMSAVAYVDRTNISLAAVDLQKDIGLTKSEFGTGSSLFFVTYILFQVPSNVILKRVGAPVWLGAILIGWGLTAAMTATVNNTLQLYFFRLLLGVMEAGTYPGINYYVAQFFPDSRLSHVFGISSAACAFGLGISAPLAAGLLSMDGFLGLRGWQWLFVMEGLPAVVLGLLMMRVLPSGPGACMTPDELIILRNEKAACQKEQGGDGGAAPRNSWRLAMSVICNVNMLVLLVVMVLSGTLRYTAMFWTPLWIAALMSDTGLDWASGSSDVEVSGVTVALLSTLPFGMAAVGSWLFGWTSVKLKDRTIHLLVLGSISGLMVVLLPWLGSANIVFGFVALMLGHLGVNGQLPLLCSMEMSFLSEEERNFGTAWVNGVANLCGLIGPMITGFVADKCHSYKPAMWLVGGMSIVSGLIAVTLEDSVRKEYWGRRKLLFARS